MISTTATLPGTSNIDSTTLELENLTLVSDTSSTTSTNSSSSSSNADNTMIELENAIRLLEDQITPLATKTQNKIEDEISNCNFLIDSGLGSKKDQAALRKTKRQLRQRRIKLWDELKVLPSLKEEKTELERQLKALRRQLGVIDGTT